MASSSSASVPIFVSPDHPMEHFFTSEGESRFVDLEFEKENEVATAFLKKADHLFFDLNARYPSGCPLECAWVDPSSFDLNEKQKAYVAYSIKEMDEKIIPLYEKAIAAGSLLAHRRIAESVMDSSLEQWKSIRDKHFFMAVFKYRDLYCTKSFLRLKLYHESVLQEETARCARIYLRMLRYEPKSKVSNLLSEILSNNFLMKHIVSSDPFGCYHGYLGLIENNVNQNIFNLSREKEEFAKFRRLNPELFARLSQHYKDEALIKVIDDLDTKEYKSSSKSSRRALCKLVFDLQKIPRHFLVRQRKEISDLFIGFMKEKPELFSQICNELSPSYKDIEEVLPEFVSLFSSFATLFSSVDRVSGSWQGVSGISSLVTHYAAPEECKVLPEVITASIIKKERIAKTALPAAENWLQQVVDGLHGYSVFSSSGSSAFEKRHFLRKKDCSYTEVLDEIKQRGMPAIPATLKAS